MNILILFSHRWRGGRAGGAETHNIELIKNLAARGHSIVFVTGKTDADSPGPAGGVAAHYELPFQTINPFDKFRSYRRLEQIVARHQIDIIHAHQRTAGYFAELLCRKRQTPYVVTVHDPWHSTPCKSSHGKLFRRLIAVSDFLNQVLIAKFGVPPERIRTIRNGVAPERFEAGNRADALRFRAAYGISPGEVVLSQVSRISKAKGQRDLIRALKLLPPELKFRCLIVGEGVERSSLERLVASYALEGKVTFCGYQSNIPVVLSATDVMVLPSHREGLPLSIVEAMLSDVPVIAARTAGVPEIITHRKDGLLFQAGDIAALAKLIAETVIDKELRLRLAEEGRKTALGRFTLSRMVDETETYYLDILNRTSIS